MSIENRLLAALPPADLGLLTPHFQRVSFEPDAVLVRSGDELDQVYFPHSGAIVFMVDMPDGETVATTLMGREGALASLSVLGPARSSVTAIARVAGTTSQISAAAALHHRVPDDVLPLTQEALAQLLGVRRTTVTLTMSNLRAAGAIPSDRRGFVEVDRARLESVACDCYGLMQRTIDRMYCQELPAPQPALAPFRESFVVASDKADAEFKGASPEGK